MIQVSGVSKSFTLHQQGGVHLPVMADADLSVKVGECVALTGVSGAGKSTLMRMIYGNYLCDGGSILVHGMQVVGADPRTILTLRRETLGYVSQFLSVLPRVTTLDVVAEPAIAAGMDRTQALKRAQELLSLLRIPEALWPLSPLTFSGGEQQRVNIARGFAYEYPSMLLDEPTASLDGANRQTVLSLIEAAKKRGASIIGIFHDEAARAHVCDREINVTNWTPKKAAA